VKFVNIEEVVSPIIKEDELDLEQQVLLRNIKELITAIIQGGDRYDDVTRNLWYLMKYTTVNEFMDNSISALEVFHKLADPTLINPNHSEIIQDIFSTMNLTEQMEKLKKELINFNRRSEIARRIITKTHEDINESRAKEEPKEGTERKMRIPKDNRLGDVKRFRKNIEGKTLPPQAQKKFEEEITRYLSIHPQHSESAITRTYLDYLSSLPWNITTEDRIDIKIAKAILDEGHYGMDDIKGRILEFLAVGKLRGAVHGKILCFVGPPGVGKTSIGKYIAKY
jgi:ATP-dependent Lon protease